MAPRPPTEAMCPGCPTTVTLHPSTGRIPPHRPYKGAPRCRFSGDYLPGFPPARPTKTRRTKREDPDPVAAQR